MTTNETVDIVQKSIENKANNGDLNELLLRVCKEIINEHTVTCVKMILEAKIKLMHMGMKNSIARRSLVYLCSNELNEHTVECIKMLIGDRVRMNGKKNISRTPLMLLCCGKINQYTCTCIRMLIDAKDSKIYMARPQITLKINKTDENGETALYLLLSQPLSVYTIKCMKILIYGGAKVSFLKNGSYFNIFDLLEHRIIFLCKNGVNEYVFQCIFLLMSKIVSINSLRFMDLERCKKIFIMLVKILDDNNEATTEYIKRVYGNSTIIETILQLFVNTNYKIQMDYSTFGLFNDALLKLYNKTLLSTICKYYIFRYNNKYILSNIIRCSSTIHIYVRKHDDITAYDYCTKNGSAIWMLDKEEIQILKETWH